jgi:D-tyrosyl-tRNA(Tyr) deacylase
VRAVVQRVSRASVTVGGREVSRIGPGLLVLLGVASGDTIGDVEWMARKIVEMRIFYDEDGRMNLGLADTGGDMLVVPQFTLLGDARKGRRPSFTGAAPPATGERLYLEFVAEAGKRLGSPVAAGVFGADMKVDLRNDGPVTLILDTRTDR